MDLAVQSPLSLIPAPTGTLRVSYAKTCVIFGQTYLAPKSECVGASGEFHYLNNVNHL